MKSRFSNFLTISAAVLAFMPILAVDTALDSYVRGHEQRHAQLLADSFSEQIGSGAWRGVDALRAIVADSPSLCAPTFIDNAQRAIQADHNLLQVLVENGDGVQYCDAFATQVRFAPLSPALSIAGQDETLQIVSFGEFEMPVLKMALPRRDGRTVSIFVPLLGQPMPTLLVGLPSESLIRVQLANGQTILDVGSGDTFDGRTNAADFISASEFVDELPLRVEIAAPFSILRAGFADLDFTLTMLSGLVGAIILILALHYVRQSKVPSFDLERAISRNEIKPFYQPVINLRTGELIGCEVLCRWQKPNGTMIAPGVFIDYAEASGLAIPMTLSLMEQVKTDLSKIAADMPNLKISINLFDGHFQDGAIVEDVQAIFGDSPIAYNQLVFEITERRPLDNSIQTHAVISGLHALGAKLALDDTGTGHSNLSYLATLGVDVIKIDRVFVDMIKPGVSQVPVLDGLITMAKDLGTEIVAEGVETEVQALYLRARGVYQAQGFLFAPALRTAAFIELAVALNATAPASGKTRPRLSAVA